MSNPINVVHVHDFTGNSNYPLPHVLVLEALAVYMIGVEHVFEHLAAQGGKQKSHIMHVSGEDDVFKMIIRQTFHFERKSDAMHFRLQIG